MKHLKRALTQLSGFRKVFRQDLVLELFRQMHDLSSGCLCGLQVTPAGQLTGPAPSSYILCLETSYVLRLFMFTLCTLIYLFFKIQFYDPTEMVSYRCSQKTRNKCFYRKVKQISPTEPHINMCISIPKHEKQYCTSFRISKNCGISVSPKFILLYCVEYEETIATSSSPQYSVKQQLFQIPSLFWENCL